MFTKFHYTIYNCILVQVPIYKPRSITIEEKQMMKPRVSWRGMLYFPVSFLSRLNQTESAVFQHYRSIVFTNDPLLGEITTYVVVPHGGRKSGKIIL